MNQVCFKLALRIPKEFEKYARSTLQVGFKYDESSLMRFGDLLGWGWEMLREVQ